MPEIANIKHKGNIGYICISELPKEEQEAFKIDF